MARRQRGSPIDGWFVLDKPQGLTSTQALAAVKRLFDAAKAGHAGTLDPLATGVLPIAFGQATKTVSFAMDARKIYRFLVRWGQETTTDDSEGEAVQISERRPTRDAIEAALPAFTGAIEQVPPAFSAIKVEGARAYALARKGEAVALAARCVSIGRLSLLDVPDADHACFEAECGKGAYVRAIARDLGRALGCFGHIVELRRTRVGRFLAEDAISLASAGELRHSAAGRDALFGVLKPVETALDDIPAVAISGPDAARLRQGQPVLLRGRDAPILKGPAYVTCMGCLVALGEVEGAEFRPGRVFNLG